MTNYIPYIGMRSQIFTALANVKGIAGENMEASASRQRFSGPTKCSCQEVNPDSLERALLQSVEIQHRVGAPEAVVSLFDRIRQLSKNLPTTKPRVAVLSKMAVTLAKNGKKQMAQDDLDVAWRLAWRDTQHPHFAEMLSNITNAQLAAGFVLQAFDTAARIPEEPSGHTDNGPPLSMRRHRPSRPGTAPCAQSPWQPVQSGDRNFRSAPCAPLRTKRRAHTPSPASQPPSRRRSSANAFYLSSSRACSRSSSISSGQGVR